MRTHWQYVSFPLIDQVLMNRQARLLLPEPLAVNKGERVVGTIHFKVRPPYPCDLRC